MLADRPIAVPGPRSGGVVPAAFGHGDGGAVGAGESELPVGEAFDAEAAFVDAVVVEGAEQGLVLHSSLV